MTKKLMLLVTIGAMLSSISFAQQPSQPARTWALIVGISKYQKLPGGQQLQFADRDAALFSEAIQKRGVNAQNVKVLTGIDATTAAIKSAVGNWLARSVSESDTVLIFFSGHGFFEREFGESYLLGFDSDPKDPYTTALSVSELGQALSRRVRSGRVLVIADAVRRDFFDPESDPNSSKSFEQAFAQLATMRAGLSAIIASGSGEFSREGQRWGGHGVFAKHLADVLVDGAGPTSNLAAATEDLFELLKGRVAQDTSGKQRPWRSGSASIRTEVARVVNEGPPATAPGPVTSSKPVETRAPEPRPVPEERNDRATPPPIATNQPSIVPGARTETRSVPKRTEAPAPDKKPVVSVTPPSDPKTAERNVATNKTPQPAPPVGREKKPEPPPIARSDRPTVDPAPSERKAETTAPLATVGNPGTGTARNPNPVPTTGTPRVTSEAAPNRPEANSNVIGTTRNNSAPVNTASEPSAIPREIARSNSPPPPNPTVPPSAVVLSRDRVANQPETMTSSVPAARAEAAPSPLVLQLEAAIAAGYLIEPRNDSAWDLYQRMQSEPATAPDAARLKPALAAALTTQGRGIVSGDVRGDNISDKVDDFKRAGQMLARARTLTPENGDIGALEKLSAAAALISLQFYDEAERALAPLQTTKLAAVENALGLVYQGKLDSWRAERAFKRASEIDPNWAAPHYNLALLYQSQKNQAALAEFEAAASRDQSNVNVLIALGDEYFTRQQWKQAADTFRKAVTTKPSDDNLHTKLGHALYSQGLQDEANREYQKAQELRRKRTQ